ncbi:hypothetical protein V1477_012021 [Vespula maculifrons]|uniref:Uncharacterized protein n=1 Tax=Vespula maculifrons TaxID=7453 RepID=A0ABD2C0V3_VESMC
MDYTGPTEGKRNTGPRLAFTGQRQFRGGVGELNREKENQSETQSRKEKAKSTMDEDAITHVRLNYLSIDESNPGEPKEKPIANTYSGIDTFTEYLRHGEHPPANGGPEDRRKGWKVKRRIMPFSYPSMLSRVETIEVYRR